MRRIVMTPSVGAPRGRRRPTRYAGFAEDGPAGPVCPPAKKGPPPPGGVPIHLTATASGVVAGATASVNTLALKDPHAVEIHAIKFSILAADNTVAVNGGMVGVSLTLGSLPVTQGYVPIWNFARGESLVDDSCTTRSYDATAQGFPYCADYVWRLPRPLYVPPGRVLVPQVQHRGVISSAIDFRISYVGRTVEEKKGKATIQVPYVTSWSSNSYALADGRTLERSNETDFRNPFTRPLHVLYFVGRSLQTEIHSATLRTVCRGHPYNLYNSLVSIKMSHSSGLKAIEDYTPIGVVMPIDQGAIWPCPHDLAPQSFYTIDLLKAAPSATSNETGYTGHVEQLQISMVGWREEDL